MRRRQIAMLAGCTMALMALGGQTANAVDTIVTFTVTSGALTVTAPPGPVSLGSATAGNTVSGPLGTVTVTDARGGTPTSDWVARVSSTSFVGPADTIPSANATYTPQSGTVVVGNGTLAAGTAGTLAAQRISMSYTGGTGNSQATWSPVLTVAIPLMAGLGTYTGTVTHSVS
ncbi:hypothetical protein ACIBCT_19745 [Streptosporangium sp. NPDC050855]|uniref:hypothetical protein n=1 Tax=Streptosporangium sp. NPDC050855 TaxID=3366194 RepID=UPI00379AEE5B